MKKKLFSLLLAMVMVIGVIPGLGLASAETITYVDGADGWTVDGPKGAEADKINELKVQTATGMSYTGDNSLYIKYNCTEDATTASWGGNTLAYTKNWVFIYNDAITEVPAADTTYTLSFYMKSIANAEENAANNYIMFYMGNSTIGEGKTTTKHMTSTTDGVDAAKAADGWKKYTATFTNISQKFNMQLQLKGEWYIDDMSLVADNNTSVNLLENGDFESTVVPTYEDLDETWTAVSTDKNDDGEIIKSDIKFADGIGYNSNKSLFVDFESAATLNTWGGYSNDHVDIVNAYADFDANTTYTASLRIKGEYNTGGLYVRMGDNQTAGETRNKFNLKSMTQGATDEEGWTEYTVTFKGATKQFTISVQTLATCYIDDVVLATADAPTVNLLENGDFEGVIVVEPVITYEELDETWTATPSDKADNGAIQKSDVKIANGIGYNSNKSLFVDFESAATLNTWGGYSNDHVDIVNAYADFDANTTYTASLKIKGEYNTGGLYVRMGDNQAAGETRNKFNLKSMTAGTTDADGWTQYSTTFKGATKQFTISVQTLAICYIDDVTLVTSDAPAVNLLENGDFEGATVVEPDTEITYEDINGSDWYYNPVENGNDDGTIKTTKIKIANGIGYNSNKSLYLDFESNATLQTWDGYQNDRVDVYNTYQEFDASKSYNVSLKVKGEYKTGGIFVQMGTTTTAGDTRNKYTLKAMTAGTTDSNGWTEYTTTLKSAAQMFKIIVQTKAAFYIDDVVLYDAADETKTNLLSNGDFEKFIEYAPKFVDAEGNAVTKLTDEHSKQTLTASAAIVVDTEIADTAQLIVCVYDGYMLKKFYASDLTDVSEEGFVKLSCDVEIPEYESVGEYKVKAYIWDSVTGLYPLMDDAVEI